MIFINLGNNIKTELKKKKKDINFTEAPWSELAIFLDKWLSFSIIDSFPITSLLLNHHCFPINGKITSFFDPWILMTSSCSPVQFHLPLWPGFTLYSLSSHLKLNLDLFLHQHMKNSIRTACVSQGCLLYLDRLQPVSPLPFLLQLTYQKSTEWIFPWSVGISPMQSHLGNEWSGGFSELSWHLLRSPILAPTLCCKSVCFAFPFQSQVLFIPSPVRHTLPRVDAMQVFIDLDNLYYIGSHVMRNVSFKST